MSKISYATIAQNIDPEAIGVEVSWSFGFGDADAVVISREVVVDLITAHGFNPIHLEHPSPVDALKCAARKAPQKARLAVKELARPNRDTPVAFGVYVRVAQDGESGDEWHMGARVRVVGGDVVAMAPEGADGMHPDAEKVAEKMASRARIMLGNCYNLDLSNMLTSLGHSLHWVSRRRNSGGVYFIPAGERATNFVKLLYALHMQTDDRAVRHQFIPEVAEIFPRPLSKAMVADAATHHFEVRIRKLVDQLRDAANAGKMREKTMQKRADRVSDLLEQAKVYRDLLAGGAQELTTRLEEIRGHYMTGIASGCEALKGEMDAFDRLSPEAQEAPQEPSDAEDEETPIPAPPAPKKGTSKLSDAAEAFGDL